MNLKNELIKGGIILFILMNLFNFLNYLFQFFMARMLTLSDYGIFATLMSLIYILNVPTESIQLIASKYSSKFYQEKNIGKIKTLWEKMTKKGIFSAIFIYLAYIPLAIFLSYFLKIDIKLLLIAGFMIFFVFIFPTNRGILQGQKKFFGLGLSFLIESLLRIIIGVFLVFLGLKVYGAIWGSVLGICFAYLISFMFIKKIMIIKRESIQINEWKSFSKSAFLMFLVFLFMLSLDILLAKRFFSEETVGIYAVASLLGKTIFFAISPISKAMFPLISENGKRNSKKLLIQTILLTSIIGLLAIVLFFLFPSLIISFLFGEKYLPGGEILGLLGISFLILSFANVLMHYLLSFEKIKNIKLFLIFPLIQIGILGLFHKNLFEYALGLGASFIILLFGFLLMIKNGQD